MKEFSITPRIELLLAIALTAATTQNILIYPSLLLVGAVVLPSAKLGDRKSFAMNGTVPVHRSLLLFTIPLAIVAAVVDFYKLGGALNNLCAKGSLCSLGSSPIKGLVVWFVISSLFIFCLLRAINTFKPFNLFHSFVAFIGAFGVLPAFIALVAHSNSFSELLFFSVGGVWISYLGFGCLATIVAFPFSIGRR